MTKPKENKKNTVRKKMKDILSKSNTKEDVEGIKEEIKNLTNRLSSLKDHSIEGVSEQVEELFSALTSIKDKGVGIGTDNAAMVINAARKHPIRMLLGAFAIGMFACCLIKK